MIKSMLFVFLGGGLGSMLRFGISQFFNTDFPYGTLLVNLLGSLLIGLFLGLFERQLITQTLLLLLATGFCGGFTTFSAFAAENLKLLETGHTAQFLVYSLGSLVLGVLMVLVGFKITKFI
ncbi:fluoride efflux transporter CrcB [Profundicola chukchiensis]|uniref:fluoride efflux transporter CrcB n=1 Tax=Profundicola chukchiensis TaxID=2961959 RepID=UPI0034E19FF2